MKYTNEPAAYTKLKARSAWDFDCAQDDMDPYFVRNPLCRIHGDWIPENIEILTKETNADAQSIIDMQTFSGLGMEDRWAEGPVEHCHTELQKIVHCLPLGKHRALIHIQKPGQMNMLHIDDVYGAGFWDYLGDSKRERLVRFFIMLDDWAPGQVMMFGSHTCLRWKRGDVIYFRWQDIPHGTANFGHTNRPLLVVTGERTPEIDSLIASEQVRDFYCD